MNKLKELRDKVRKNNKGFSLVELIVVIVILAIFIGVTIGGIYSYVNKSRINTDINNAASIQSVISAVVADADVNKALKEGMLTNITWSDAVPADNITVNVFYLPNNNDTAAKNAVKTVIATKVKELLTDGLPAPKAGGSFEIQISKFTGGSIKATCKAYSTKNPSDQTELKPES